jgi:hypothetical protein
MTPVSPIVPGLLLQEVIYAKDQPEYIPLPVHRDPDGLCTSRWKLTWRERLFVLFHGYFYLQQLTFNQPLQPIRPFAHEAKPQGSSVE